MQNKYYLSCQQKIVHMQYKMSVVVTVLLHCIVQMDGISHRGVHSDDDDDDVRAKLSNHSEIIKCTRRNTKTPFFCI